MENAKMMDKRVSLKSAIALVLIAVLVASGVTYVLAVSPSSTFTVSPGVYPGAPSYTVWKEGSNYFAKDANGLLAYSGSNAIQVAQYCHDQLPLGGLIFFKAGEYLFSNTLFITNPHISLIGEGIGDVDGGGTILKAVTGCSKLIYMKDSRWFRMEFLTLDASDIADYCFYAENYNNTAGGEANMMLNNVYAWGVSMGKCYNTISPVKITGSTVVHITNCFFHHGYIALWLQDCTDIWISNCDIEMGVNGIRTENCHHVHITSVKIGDCREQFANTNYAGTTNAAAVFFAYLDTDIEIENLIILEFMLHGIRFSPDVVGPVTLNNIVIMQSPPVIPIGTSYAIWNQGCSKILASNIDIWDKNSTSPTNIAVYDQGNDNSWINVNVRNCTAAWSFTGSDYRIFRWNINGKPTENSGTAAIISATSLTFSHGLAGTPTYVTVGWKDLGYGTWKWSATSTQITITVAVSGTYTFSWYAENKP